MSEETDIQAPKDGPSAATGGSALLIRWMEFSRRQPIVLKALCNLLTVSVAIVTSPIWFPIVLLADMFEDDPY